MLIADPVFDQLKAQPRQLDGRLFTATVATNLRRAGVDTFTIKQITGHKTLAMLERYNTIDVDDLQPSLSRS